MDENPYEAPPHISFSLSAQRALLTHVTPPLRSVSMSADEAKRRWKIRFVFDGRPSESELESAKCAVTEILSDFPDWEYEDEFLFIPQPNQFKRLDWVVYERCEDEWVHPSVKT